MRSTPRRPAARFRAGLTLALATALLAACGGTGSTTDGSNSSSPSSTSAADGSTTAPSTEAPSGEPLVVNMVGGVSTLDPAQVCNGFDVSFTGNFYTRLTQYGLEEGPDGTQQANPADIQPWLAKSWEISEDGLTYTFALHEGAKFPSGQPMDAEAVKYSLDRVMTTNGCGNYYLQDGFFSPLLVEKVEAPDAATVVITLSHPDGGFLQALAQAATGIVDKSVVDQHGGVVADEVNEWMAGNLAGSGPFLLESYAANSKAVLVANPDYFGPPPASEKILVNFVGDDSTLVLEAKSGAADVTLGLTKQSANEITKDGSLRLIANDTTQATQVHFQAKRAPMDNQKVREALQYAVPYQDILDKVALGYGTLFDGPFAPLIPQYSEELGKVHAYDLDKAKSLLAESGVSLPIELEIIMNGAVPAMEQIATILQSVWSQIGVNLTIDKLPLSDYSNRANNTGDYDLMLGVDGPGVVDGGFYLGYAMGCSDAFSGSSVCVPGADELLTQARQETDDTKRQQLYDEITSKWIADASMIQLFGDKAITVLNPRVTSYAYSQHTDMRTWSK